jgi:hypothetical protein
VIEDAGLAAERYGLDRELSRFVFEWIISRTLHLEVEYLQRLTPTT